LGPAAGPTCSKILAPTLKDITINANISRKHADNCEREYCSNFLELIFTFPISILVDRRRKYAPSK